MPAQHAATALSNRARRAGPTGTAAAGAAIFGPRGLRRQRSALPVSFPPLRVIPLEVRLAAPPLRPFALDKIGALGCIMAPIHVRVRESSPSFKGRLEEEADREGLV